MTHKVKITQLCLTFCNPMDYRVHGILQPRNTGVGSLSLLQWIFLTQESNRSSALQADSLPAELPGKPKKDRIKGRGEQPDEEVHRARPERVPSAGAPVLVELGCDTLLARGSVGSSLNPNLGRLHHVGVIVD